MLHTFIILYHFCIYHSIFSKLVFTMARQCIQRAMEKETEIMMVDESIFTFTTSNHYGNEESSLVKMLHLMQPLIGL